VVNAPAGPTTPVITWATPAPITAGTALSATQLNATTTVAGSFAYSPVAGTVLTAGSHSLTTTFTPTDTTLYTSANKTVTLVVNAAAGPVDAFWVYDAADVLIGPLRGTSTVTFEVGGENYSAGVGPDGWLQAVFPLYFFDSGCTNGPYEVKHWSAIPNPPAPAPMPSHFFRSLSVAGSTGYYATGQYVSRVLSSTVPNVWYRANGSGPCTPLDWEGTAWFDPLGVVPLTAHQPPFTIR